MKRTATAVWKGSGKNGSGHLSTASQVLKSTPYSYSSRFEEGGGTNPEELIAAAHAGCFTMKLSFNLSKAGFEPESLETTCELAHDVPKGEITSSHLKLRARVPGIEQRKFEELVEHARVNCPVSKLLKTEITCDASLEN